MATRPSSGSTSSPPAAADSRARPARRAATPVWDLVVDSAATGAENMARDRKLLDQLVGGERPATLRFYSWKPACISLGLGQGEEILDTRAVRAADLDVVRRPTGGQALLHDREITYSVVASQQDPVVGGTLSHTYRAITEAFLTGLADLGIAGEGAACEPRPAAGVSPVCFASASAEEILVGGRKLLASAQWRSRGAFLQHGSLLLEDRQGELPGLLRDHSAHGIQPMSVSLDELLVDVPSVPEIIRLLVLGFERTLGIGLSRAI